MKKIAPLAALLIVTWAFAQVDQAEDGERLQQLQLAIARAEIACREESSAACRVNLPLAQLKLKKARLRTERGYSGAGGSSDDIRLGMRLAEMAEAGEVYQPPRSVLTELAYVAANDGSVQPYYVFVPRDYDASRPWPLIVFLHGYVPSITVLDPWVLSDEVCRIAEANGCLLMLPYGRRNSDFQGAGEVDVFDSIAHMREVLNVDPRRIYLSGVSMGGMGAWTIGLRNPGVFAAIAPISGQRRQSGTATAFAVVVWRGRPPCRPVPLPRIEERRGPASPVPLSRSGLVRPLPNYICIRSFSSPYDGAMSRLLTAP